MKKFLFLSTILFLNISANKPFEFINNKTNGALDKKFIQRLVDIFKIDIFFETGTYNGETTLNAIPYCKKVYTVELHEKLFKKAKNKLSGYKNTYVYHGRSDDIIKSTAPCIEGTILFWLDAHYSGQGTALSFNNPDIPNAVTAIREELEEISKANIQNCIILIDDIRGFGTKIKNKEYIGCWAYPTVQELQHALLKINPNFELALLGDMLLAYDKNKYKPPLSEIVVACTKTRLYDGYNLNDEELIQLEEKIMHAPLNEKAYIEYLYKIMTDYKDPMFWHDLWYGLTQLGSENFFEAKQALSKVKVRSEHLNKNRQVSNKIITYDHWRIEKYLEMVNFAALG